ncbi:MAG: hypothetical protein OXT07_10515 [bacterium]|nr:hypothetical protein [bacterium]MDE0117039.1 hypothetical protein [bacterium]
MSAAKPANDADRADDATFLRSTRLDPRYRSTRYPNTAAPPSSAGGPQVTDTLPAAPAALTVRGADGRVACTVPANTMVLDRTPSTTAVRYRPGCTLNQHSSALVPLTLEVLNDAVRVPKLPDDELQ